MTTPKNVEDKTLQLVIETLEKEYPKEYRKLRRLFAAEEKRIIYGTGKPRPVGILYLSAPLTARRKG